LIKANCNKEIRKNKKQLQQVISLANYYSCPTAIKTKLIIAICKWQKRRSGIANRFTEIININEYAHMNKISRCEWIRVNHSWNFINEYQVEIGIRILNEVSHLIDG